jgi:HEAT repeat protein
MAQRRFNPAWFSILALAVLVPLAGLADEPPRLKNARLETRTAAPNLDAAFRAILNAQAAPAWVGYAAPLVGPPRQMCCWNSWSRQERGCGACRMDDSSGFSISDEEPVTTKLEGARRFFVLIRVENRKAEKIRTYSEGCELDAGGLPLIWLADVRPAESIALLTSFVSAGEESAEKRLMDHAVAAIALHDDPAADRALESFLATSRPERLRKKVVFWLGAERGRRGYEVLRRIVRDDPSDKVREQAIFALSVSREPEAVDVMIDLARTDPSTRVRGQALFWLGQKAGKKAVGAISEAVERDPETDVKKKAVFALSQLPADEGVPLLIQIARTNRNPAVRKQAIFWLGQSKDSRALAFFEEILKP